MYLKELFEKNKKTINVIVFFVVCSIFISIFYLFTPFNNKDAVLHIERGESLTEIKNDLYEHGVINNKNAFYFFVKVFGSNKIKEGDYIFYRKTPVYKVAWQITKGIHNIEPIKITFREGIDREEMANILADKLAGFRKDIFMSSTLDKEGYLFPDTYFFFPLDSSEEIIKKMNDNFNKKIKNVNLNEKDLKEVIIMASILEGEASGENDAITISGILWKRLKIGMPLQVDTDKITYKEKGLPNKPLNNPGLSFIKAAAQPSVSDYLYYLHDKDGNVHYAKSFEEHKININKYLK